MLKWLLDKRERPVHDLERELTDMRAIRHRLETRMRECEERIDALEGAHAKLRSKFYGELSAGNIKPPERDMRTRDWVGGSGTLADAAFRRNTETRK